MNYYDASAPAPAPHGGAPAPSAAAAAAPHGAAPHGAPHGHHPFQQPHPAMMHPHHGYPPHYGPPHHPGMPMAPMAMCHPAAAGAPPAYHPPHYPHPHQMMAMAGGGVPPPPPASAPSVASSKAPTPVPSHLPPGVRVPTPRAVSLEVQHPEAKAESESAAATVSNKDAGVEAAAAAAEAESNPPSLSSSAPPSRPESVEPVLQPGNTAVATATAPTVDTAAAAADIANTAAAAPPVPAPLSAMMLAAATVAGNATGTGTGAAAGTGTATGNGLTPTSGNRLPAEEVASFLMTLKHRSVSPDLVDDTASCLASMRMPHLMPASNGDSAAANGVGADGGAGDTNGTAPVTLGAGSLQTTDGQILKFRETARPLGLPMATPEDRFWLSDVSCFVRAHCCEFFVAEGQEDNLTKTRSKSGKVSALDLPVHFDICTMFHRYGFSLDLHLTYHSVLPSLSLPTK